MADSEQDKDGGKKEERPAVERRRKEGYRSIYAENVNVETSLFDIRMTVGDLIGGDENKLLFEDHFTVIFSPQHAKAVAALLAQNIKKYETEFGEIRLPESLFPRKSIKPQPQPQPEPEPETPAAKK